MTPFPKSFPDYCDRHGATRLMALIESHWAAQGRPIKCQIVLAGTTLKSCFERYDVRSDLINGLPPELI